MTSPQRTPDEFVVINGHAPWCAYIRTIRDLDGEEPCDCAGWNDEDDGYWDEDEEVWS